MIIYIYTDVRFVYIYIYIHNILPTTYFLRKAVIFFNEYDLRVKNNIDSVQALLSTYTHTRHIVFIEFLKRSPVEPATVLRVYNLKATASFRFVHSRKTMCFPTQTVDKPNYRRLNVWENKYICSPTVPRRFSDVDVFRMKIVFAIVIRNKKTGRCRSEKIKFYLFFLKGRVYWSIRFVRDVTRKSRGETRRVYA